MSEVLSYVETPVLNVGALKASCAGCSMHQLCLPMGMDEAEIIRLDQGDRAPPPDPAR
jgi:CRP/FNR family transcriptional regulator